MDSKKIKYLREAHARYSAYGEQFESQHQKALVAHHHPYAKQYLAYRQFFDALKYASGEGKRFYSFMDEFNSSQYARPFLLVKGAYIAKEVLRGRMTTFEFIKRLAASNWPPEAETGLYHGGFLITTGHPAMQAELAALLGHEDTRWDEKNSESFFFPLRDAAAFATIKGVIDRYHAGHTLHPVADGQPEAAPPLKQAINLDDLGRIVAQDAWL